MNKLKIDLNLTPVTVHDWHWAAGLFEGEGTITIAVRNRDQTYRIVVIMANTDKEVIDWFAERFGGYTQAAYGKRPGRKPAWHWTLFGPRAEKFIRELRPFLRTSRVRAKADLAIEFREHQKANGYHGGGVPATYKPEQRGMYLKMRGLNARGVAA